MMSSMAAQSDISSTVSAYIASQQAASLFSSLLGALGAELTHKALQVHGRRSAVRLSFVKRKKWTPFADSS